MVLCISCENPFLAIKKEDKGYTSEALEPELGKIDPIITEWPIATNIDTYGDTLSTSTLSGGIANVPGTFEWANDTTIPNWGTNGYLVRFIPTDEETYNTRTRDVDVTVVNKADPTVNWPTNLTAIFGQTLSEVNPTGNGTSTPAGTFEWNELLTTLVGDVGSQPHSMKFTPNDTTNYTTPLPTNVNITVTAGTIDAPAWPADLEATYGDTLGDVSLIGYTNGNTGTFTWTGPLTTPVGDASPPPRPHSMTFTPNDTNYGPVTQNVNITVNKATPVVTGLTAAPITYPAALSTSTLTGGSASFGGANVPGSFAWTNGATIPTAGTNSYPVTFTPTDSTNYKIVEQNVSITVAKANPTVTWPEGLTATYGQTLSDVLLTGKGSGTPNGTFAWAEPTTPVGDASPPQRQHSMTFTPTNENYSTLTKNDVSIYVDKANPVVNWPEGLTAVVGQILSDIPLTSYTNSGGTAGAFAWDVPTESVGAVSPPPRPHVMKFTPTDADNYNWRSESVDVTVLDQTASVVTWPTGLEATYGDTLGDVTLPADTGGTAGMFTWTAGNTTSVGNAGTQSHNVTFTPTDPTFSTRTQNVNVTVHKANPTVTTWPTATDISYGAALSTSSLTGGVASPSGGSFAWTNGSTIPLLGTNSYEVTFTPADPANYNTAAQNVNITVNKADPEVTWPTGLTAAAGQTLADISLASYTNTPAGTFSWTTPTDSVGSQGAQSHNMTFTPTDTTNYNTVTNNVTVTVGKANPTVNWPTGLTAYYGQTLASISLPGNGTATPGGTFTWTTPSTPVGNVGPQTHSMTFTPTDTANYNTVTNNVSITVQAMPDMEMVWIPGGTFIMGSPPDEPDRDNYTGSETQHPVTLSRGFWIGKYEVTQEQYEAVMGINPSYFTTANGRPPATGETDARRPVEMVSWYDALVFCNRLSIAKGLNPAYSISGSTNPATWGTVPTSNNATWDAVVVVAGSNGYRLPTEAQWEYACRAGTTTAYYTGATISDATGWYLDNSNNRTHEVGRKSANAWGLYDITGNVYEMCWDWSWWDYSSDAQTDPTGPVSGTSRRTRSGGWQGVGSFLRSAQRFYTTVMSDKANTSGIRLVLPDESGKTNPTVTWPTNLTATIGQTLSNISLPGNGFGVPAGTFSWTAGGAISVGSVGTQAHSLTFTPSNTSYNTITGMVNVTVNKANPTVTWPTAANITSGAALSTSTLSGGSASFGGTNVPGTFAWTTPTTIPAAGTNGYEVTFTPTDTTNYNTVTGNVNITVVAKVDPVVNWPTNLTATYGQTLSNITLPGNGYSVPVGTFTWTTPSTSVGNAGTQSHNMIFTPEDTANYNTLTSHVNITVNKANPYVTWPWGLSAVYGQTLASIGLPSRTGESVYPGTLTWTTPATPVGPVGTPSHNVTFTPTDTANYNTVTSDVSITVRNVLEIEMVPIQAGTFMMGSANSDPTYTPLERPQWQVTISTGFLMSKYQVTQAQYEAVMGSLPSNLSYPGGVGGNHPIYSVTWYEAIVFCNKLSIAEGLAPAYRISGSTNPSDWGAVPNGSDNATWAAVQVVPGSSGYRLPTEAQWEYACRAGTTTAYNTGTNQPNTNIGWYNSNSDGMLHGVGLKPPNAWGLYDMHGNIYEWCWDYGSQYPGSVTIDPTGEVSGTSRMIRSGGFSGSGVTFSRSAYRFGLDPWMPSYGFRVVLPSTIEMVQIPSGTFTMGSPPDEPGRIDDEIQHTVTLSTGFWMGKYEVTQAQYEAVMGANPSNFTTAKGRPPATGETDARRPVERVSWYDAVEFCNKLSQMEGLTPYYTIDKTTIDPNNINSNSYDPLKWLVTRNTSANGYRLPTDAEWEYACRAGTTTAYHTGATISDNTGWYTDNSGSRTHEVGLKSPNAWGLYDMHGNVYEWCWDWTALPSSAAQTDPDGAASGSGRVIRGGAWMANWVPLRSAYAPNSNPYEGVSYIGFRVVRP